MSLRQPWYLRALSALKSQWLASILLVPLLLFGLNTLEANRAAREARVQTFNVERLSQFQASGKALDLKVAAYFDAIAEGKSLIGPKLEVRKALAEHGSDVKALRGILDTEASNRYMAALNRLSKSIENDSDILATGSNITSLAHLVQERDKLVDKAMSRVA